MICLIRRQRPVRRTCRQLAKKGRIVKVGAKGTNYRLPGPPPIERFDLPDDIEQQIKAWLDKRGELPDDRHEVAYSRIPLSACGRRGGLGATPLRSYDLQPRNPYFCAYLFSWTGVAPSPRLRRD